MLIVVRHGEVARESRGRWWGRLEAPLSEEGRRAARDLAPLLAPFGPHRLLTSPLSRAKETAEALGASLGLKAAEDAHLTEMDLGAFQGLTPEEIARRHPEAWRAYLEDNVGCAPPGGEPYAAMAARVTAWAESLPQDETVIAVTHRGPLLALVCHALGLAPEGRLKLSPSPAGASGLTLRPRRLVFFNWTAGGIP